MSPNTKTEKLLLIDAFSLFYRAFHALPGFTTSSGQPTGAVFGVASMLLRFLDEEAPDYVAVASDAPGPTFRHEAYAAYKAHRPEMPDDLRAQIPVLRELVEAMGLPIYEMEGFEADDVLGTLATQAKHAGKKAVILTGDKDTLQLVDESVEVLLTRRGITLIDRYDRDLVKEKIGVEPEQIVDWKALVGDPSDNIPGVPGIGPKTAVRLLNEFSTVEALLERLDEVKGKNRERLEDNKETLQLSKALARIETAAPIQLDWEQARFSIPVNENVLALFRRLEMARLIDDAKKRYGLDIQPEQSAGTSDLAETQQVAVRLIRTNEADAWASDWEERRGAALIWALYDGESPLSSKRAAVVLAWGGDGEDGDPANLAVDIVPILEDGVQPESSIGTAWERIVANNGIQWLAHDAKSLRLILQLVALPMPDTTDDLMLASYVLSPGQGTHSPADVALKYADVKVDDIALVQKGASVPWGEIKESVSALSAGLTAAWPHIQKRMEEEQVVSVYREYELPLVKVLAEMEWHGVAIDTDVLKQMSEAMASDLEHLTESIYKAAGTEFNINSPKQLADVLFNRLGLPVIKRTKTGPSTNAEVLEELADKHEVVAKLLEYRQYSKLKSTYVDALPLLVDERTGRLHTTFNQAVTATGRLSSVHPNLQNIPVRTQAGRKIRQAFVPGSSEYLLLAADYSQIELRVLAHMSGDEAFIAAFREGKDIHVATASEIFGVPESEVTREMREAAKAVNFGIVYGISSFGLARDTGFTRQEAQSYIDAYFERYPAVARYMKERVDAAKETGWAETISGRRRWIPELTSRNWARRSFAERAAMNTPIQGSAADIIKRAMVRVHGRLKHEDLRAVMLLQVHDELLFEVHKDDVARVGEAVKAEMEDVMQLAVPLVVDVKVGPNWLDMEELVVDAGAS